MSYILIAAFLLIIGFLLAAFSKKKTDNNLPYQKAPILNPGEKNIYEILKLISKENYIIFTKVRLLDLLKITQGGKKYHRFKNKVSQKHIDFILCDPKNYDVKLAIELDGQTHNNIIQNEKDDFKNKVLQTIKIPILRIQAKRVYSPAELKEKIDVEIEKELKENKKALS